MLNEVCFKEPALLLWFTVSQCHDWQSVMISSRNLTQILYTFFREALNQFNEERYLLLFDVIHNPWLTCMISS